MADRVMAYLVFSLLFVRSVPVVCDERRRTKEGPYATQRQAEAILSIAPEIDPCLCRVPGKIAVSGLSQVADWPPSRSPTLLLSACWVGILVMAY